MYESISERRRDTVIAKHTHITYWLDVIYGTNSNKYSEFRSELRLLNAEQVAERLNSDITYLLRIGHIDKMDPGDIYLAGGTCLLYTSDAADE